MWLFDDDPAHTTGTANSKHTRVANAPSSICVDARCDTERGESRFWVFGFSDQRDAPQYSRGGKQLKRKGKEC